MIALLIVDIQNDFLPGGAIPVDTGKDIIPVINDLIDDFTLVLATKDWHPKGHISFAKTHHKKVGSEIKIKNGTIQELWPDHCVQNTPGAEFSPLIHEEKITKIFYKGERIGCDSYSAFYDNNREVSTGLDTYLQMHQIKTLYITGLTAEYCVKFTALDAISLGYTVFVVQDAIGFIDPSVSDKYFNDLLSKDIKIICSKNII